ncbi:putative ABC exporter domain-containing protein [Rhodopirellula halodulae]|uniref:putative ABC exporter domain-containing protein n=1 Tax=Rhodopirellula halodulae TaxID=2894198 RepID=UPI001E5E50B1|nr:putative ABC exporter domain-containing protein [Rhodopirellula sp. JC737]MCC9654968.1 putative ABC exporter domain-containing protein [Rhodopirellula sp. JC737]
MSGRASIIDPALSRLIGVLLWSALRQMGRHLKTPAGALVGILAIGTVSMGLMPMFIAAWTGSLDGVQIYARATETIPLMMLLIVAMAIYFDIGQQITELRPPELQFVLAGPFTDHQILSYRLMTIALTWVVSSSLMAVFALPTAGSYLSAFFAIYTGGMTITSLTTLHAFSQPVVPSGVRDWFGRVLLGGVVILMISSLPLGIRDNGFSWQRWLLGCQTSSLGRVMTLPFVPFDRLLHQPLGLPMFVWLAVSISLPMAGFAMCYRVRSGFAELAVAGVSRKQERVARMRSGQFGSSQTKERRSTFRLPGLPWLGGAGPVAWQQLVFVLRRHRSLIVGLWILGFLTAIGFIAFQLFRPNVIHLQFREWSMVAMMIAACYLSFLMTISQPLGLAASPRTLTWFRTLPVHPFAITVGMLAGHLAMMWCIRFAFLPIGFSLSPRGWVETLSFAVAGFALDLTYASTVNFVSAATSLRALPTGTPDVLQGGRTMLYMLVLGIGLLPTLIFTALVAAAVAVLTEMDRTAIGFAVATALALPQPLIWWVSSILFRNRELFQAD